MLSVLNCSARDLQNSSLRFLNLFWVWILEAVASSYGRYLWESWKMHIFKFSNIVFHLYLTTFVHVMLHSVPFSPQRMGTQQSQEKSIKLLPAAPRDPLQTARTSLRLTNLFLQLTAQQNVPRRSVPTGLLTQLTISETMRSTLALPSLPMALSVQPCCRTLVLKLLCVSWW